MNAYIESGRNIGLERAESGLEREEGSGEGGYSGRGARRAGRREGKAGREKARKKPSPVGTRLGLGKGWVSAGRVCHQSQPATRQPVGVGLNVPCKAG